MMHDGVLERMATVDSDTDRRCEDRMPCPTELTIVWHHDLDAPGRYRLMNVSDRGLAIQSSLPMVTGMTGMALRLLPEGTPIDRPVMVRWVHPMPGSTSFDIGLSFL
ncbi:MAG: hypothetical protein KC983_11765 [Phycisphaerales bacterium]|nr:hypothetical protein [Phycisphaerales bacterium]